MQSIIGIAVLLAVALLLSDKRSAINKRTVIIAFLLQASLGAFVLYVPAGQAFLLTLTNGVQQIIAYSDIGIEFLFGDVGNKSLGFIFAFNVLPVIVFFSSLITVLYHLGIMTRIVRLIGGGLQKLLKTSRPESMSAAANIFAGQTEAPLVVKPFIPSMTRSELYAIMVGGLASIAGSVMVGYAALGVELKYLIAASFMAAPGGLLMAKLMVPEQQTPNDELEGEGLNEQKYTNIFDAAASGASAGMQIAMNVGAMLLAFIALIAMINGLLSWFGSLFGYDSLSLQMILGYIFQPVAYLIGVPWHEANIAGSFIGQKVVINEFVAYQDFVSQKETLSAQSQVVITFALCGFANLSSIAILMGGLGQMAPTRRQDIAKLGLKAVAAATLANFMSAALAGLFV